MQYIEAQELKKRGTAGLLLLDVREREEFEAGHIKGAVLMPWHEIEEKIAGIKKERPIVVYCEVGPRSLKAAKVLKELGYKNVEVLKYGYEGWELENLVK